MNFIIKTNFIFIRCINDEWDFEFLLKENMVYRTFKTSKKMTTFFEGDVKIFEMKIGEYFPDEKKIIFDREVSEYLDILQPINYEQITATLKKFFTKKYGVLMCVIYNKF